MDVNLRLPKFILIGRDALSHRPEQVLEAMKMQKYAGAFATCDLDAKLLEGLFSPILGVNTPFIIVADFPFDLGSIQDDGSLTEMPLPQQVTDVSEHDNNPAGS
jgi:hypothetical protein